MSNLPSLTQVSDVDVTGMCISCKVGIWIEDEISGVNCSVCNTWSPINRGVCPKCKAIMKTVRYREHGPFVS